MSQDTAIKRLFTKNLQRCFQKTIKRKLQLHRMSPTENDLKTQGPRYPIFVVHPSPKLVLLTLL